MEEKMKNSPMAYFKNAYFGVGLLITVVSVFNFLLPDILQDVSKGCFCSNPGRLSWKETNTTELDLAVSSEGFVPCLHPLRQAVGCEANCFHEVVC